MKMYKDKNGVRSIPAIIQHGPNGEVKRFGRLERKPIITRIVKYSIN